MSDKEHGSSEKTRDTQAQANEQNNTLTSPQDTGQEDAIASEQMKIQTSTPVYSVFSRRMKIFITVISSFGSIISPLSSTIYLPALNALSKDFNVSTSQINLTVTTYSILQGLAPSFCEFQILSMSKCLWESTNTKSRQRFCRFLWLSSSDHRSVHHLFCGQCWSGCTEFLWCPHGPPRTSIGRRFGHHCDSHGRHQCDCDAS